MYLPRWASGLLLGLLLSGCANFRAISEFSHQTEKLTQATGEELDFVVQDCARVARSRRIIEGLAESTAGCAALKTAVIDLAATTNEVLAAWGRLLGALAEGSRFDYAAQLGKTRRALSALKDGSGAPLVDRSVVTSGLAAIDLILKVATESSRRDAVVQLLAQSAHARVLAQHLRSVFAQPDSQQSPYTLQIGVDDQGLVAASASLQVTGLREPIRSREWQDMIDAHRATLRKRGSGEVAASMDQALDHWLRAMQTLGARAFEPDAREWRDQFKALDSRVEALRDALRTP